MSTADLKMYCCGFLLAAAGLAIRLLVNRRKFGRRGPAGLQRFSSYGRALITLFAENMLNLAGLLLILAGACLIIIVYFI